MTITCSAGSAAAPAVGAAPLQVASADLLVVGPGVLGSLVAQKWLTDNAGAKVTGLTRTTERHSELRAMGIEPVARAADGGPEEPLPPASFPFVIFCVPPSGSEDYVADVRAAARRWSGEGALLFTSSVGVYDVDGDGLCDEDSPVAPLGASPRTDRLLRAEAEVLAAGGSVVRLAGLYTLERGAHTFWLKQGAVAARPDAAVNLIHYEDAASLCVAALSSRARGAILVGCDGRPVSRGEIMDLTLRSGKFEGEFKGFTTAEGPLGKRVSNAKTRRLLQWQPAHPSFGEFLGVETGSSE